MNNLEHYRKKAGLTQDQLAEKAFISHKATISRAERGLADLPGKQWQVIAEVLGCTVDELLGEKVI